MSLMQKTLQLPHLQRNRRSHPKHSAGDGATHLSDVSALSPLPRKTILNLEVKRNMEQIEDESDMNEPEPEAEKVIIEKKAPSKWWHFWEW